MSFWNKVSNAINKTASFLEEMEEAPKKQALKDGYDDYINGRISGWGTGGFGCSYSDSMALNNLYEKGAYKAYNEEMQKRPLPRSRKNTITHRDKHGNITGTSTRD